MWFWVLGGALLVVFFGLRYVMQERKRREMEAEAAFQRERLQQATERQRRLQQAQKEKGAASASGPRLLILWGSQMGTAQEFAESLAEEAKDLGFSSECVDLEMFDTDTLAEEKTVVFVVATYGDGDPTDNAKQFAEWLHDEQRGEDELANVSFGVFGLGSRSYDHFCAMGHKTDERMAQLGAKRFVAMGEGDDDSSLEEDFDKWKKKLWSSLCQRFGMGNTKAAQGKSRRRTQLVRHDLKVNPRLRITEHWEPRRDASTTATTTTTSSSSSTSSSTPTYLTIGTPDARKPFAAPIRVNRELHTPQSDRSCRHVEIALQGVLRYEAGDHLGVYAENDAQVVDHLLSRLNINAEQAEEIISLINTSNQKIHTPPATIRRILTSFVDITTPPRRSVLAGLAEHASDEAEKQQLQKMGDPSDDEGAQEYNQRIKQELRTIGEVLELFPSVRVPVDLLVELLPRLAPRYYSISSSSKAHPDSVHITAVVTTFTTPTGRLHNGVCTTWLRRLGAGDKIPCFVRTSEFRLPANPATDIIMIGPGTGLAPFRGFIQERRAIHAPGKNVLFFGCRSPDIDHIYKEEMEAYVNDGTLILHLAYSRVSDKKVYVQHRLQEQGRQMWDLIEGGAYIYVCGDGQSMAHDVRSAILSLASTYGSHSAESAEQYLATLQQRKRYQTDVW